MMVNEDEKKKRNHFSKSEDNMLRELVKKYGNDWITISKSMPNRSVRQVREHWQNNLSANIEKRKWTKEEDNLLKKKVFEIGSKWKQMEEFFPGRTSYNIRNRWTCIKRLYMHVDNNCKLNIKADKQNNNNNRFIIPSLKVIDKFKLVFDDEEWYNNIKI